MSKEGNDHERDDDVGIGFASGVVCFCFLNREG